MNYVEVLKKLAAVAQPSGLEQPQAAVLAELAKPFVDEVYTDALGNLICHKKGPGKKMMLPAHMDVIGFMVTYIDEKGFLRFAPVGGHTSGEILGAVVKGENGIRGSIWADDTVPADATCNSLDKTDMYIDIGASCKEEAEKLAPIGSYFTFDAEVTDTGFGTVMMPYADNLAGCAVLLGAMEQIREPKNDLYFVFSVQEEVGLRGAKAAAWSIAPHVGIAVDVTDTGDAPCAPEVGRMAVKVGAGPTIKYKDSSLLCNPQVIAHLIKSAKKAGVAYQNEVLVAGGTDAGAMQRSRGGVLSGAVSLPCRNIHNPGEVVSLSDLEGAAKLIAAAAELEF